MRPETRGLSKGSVAMLVIATGLYWFWESRAEGNIRVDLLLIYPALTAAYLIALWPRFRLGSILMTAALMAMNFWYMVLSYDLFGKNRG